MRSFVNDNTEKYAKCNYLDTRETTRAHIYLDCNAVDDNDEVSD